MPDLPLPLLLDRRPPLEALIADPVYQDFVLLPYQRERRRAERFATRLRQLGIAPDAEDGEAV